MADGGGDCVSLLSSVTPSDEEEKVVVELTPQTPEVPVPIYSDEELEKLITYVKGMTMLFALNQEDWTETTEAVIRRWFLEVNELMLKLFYDGNVLTASLAFPLAPVYDSIYFLREPNQIFTVDGFHDEVIFGTLYEDIDGALLRILEKNYSPIFFKYNEWSENVKSHLCTSLHDFLSFLSGLHYKISGNTVLYIPYEGHNLSIEDSCKDREMLKRLEQVAVHWGSQIRLCLTDKEQLVPYDLLCPFDEFDFWLYRHEVLQGLDSQLKSANILHIIKILQKAQSVYIKQILELTQQCNQEIKEAKSNINYLQLLVEPCRELDLSESPAEVPKQLLKIVHFCRFIWLNSEYYNTKEYITGLFRALSNQIIIYCRNKIDIRKVLNGNPRFGIRICDMAIDCCLSYKEIYDIMSKEHAKRNVEIGWNLDSALIFNHVDAFIKRMQDLIDICEAMIVFGRIDEEEIIPKPMFGGNRGKEFERTCEEIEYLFMEGLNNIKNSSINVILNVHNNQWYKDIVNYKKMISEVEEIVENLISNVFLSISNVEEGIEALCTLNFFSYRQTLRNAYLRQVSDVWNMFITEISDTNRIVFEQTKERSSYLPKNSSKAIILKVNLNRITRLKELLQSAEWLPVVSQSIRAYEDYEHLNVNYTRNIKKIYDDWIDSFGFDFARRLDRTLMIRSKTHSGLLECNIDQTVLELCEEARYFEILGFPIPVNINQIYSKYKAIKLVYENVLTVVLDYNKILASLSKEERKLFRALILACDTKIMPGINKLTWGGEFSDAYIGECVKHMAQLQEFLDIYKIANRSIAEICEKICDTPVLKFTMNSVVELKVLVDRLNEYSKNATITLMGHYKSIIDLIKIIYKGFEMYIKNMANEWLEYVRKFDRMIEEALVQCARNSLQVIFIALHGDATMDPSPILSMEVNIQDKKILFTPEISEISSVLGNLLQNIIEYIEQFPRLGEKFHLPLEEDSKPFHCVIADDEDCNYIQRQIIKEVESNEEQLKNYLAIWSPFKSIWDVDKDLFMQKYGETEATVATFYANIERYGEIENQILMQETITNVYFVVVNSNNLKNSIIKHTDEWQRRHINLLKRKAKDKILDIYLYINKKTELIQTVPRTIAAMQQSIRLYEELEKEIPLKEAEFPSIFDYFKALDRYEIFVLPNLRTMVDNLPSEWAKYLNNLKVSEEMLKNSKDEFKLDLLNQAEDFKETTWKFVEQFTAHAPTTPQTTASNALDILKEYRNILNDLYMKENRLIGDLSIFNINQPENLDLIHIDREMRALEDVWELVNHWQYSWLSYKMGSFWLIEIDEMENNALTLVMRLKRLCKTYQEKKWEILETTRKQIEEFRKTLPLIVALKNPAMRPRHWTKVKRLVETDFDENSENLKLESIIAMNFQAYSEQIQDISNAATMELQIENGIKNITDTWQTMMIEIVPFKNGIYRIKSADDCFQMLDENTILISTIKSTRFVEPFAKDVDYWEKTLSYIMETLEQALIVQRQWLYLDNIFGGEDIQKQLPDENSRFIGITGNWKEITAAMFSAGPVLKATHIKPPNWLLEKLTLMADELEIIQRALEVYLVTKRQLFPRFYFISNDDLLEILGNAKKPDQIQMHMKKLFDNLYKLELKKVIGKKVRWEANGMYSDDGEYVEFLRPLTIDGPSEYWLNLVENAMHLVLRDKLRLTRASLKKFLTKRDKWLAMWPGQLCLTSSKIQWTSDCTRSLRLCKMIDMKKPLKRLKHKQKNVLAKLSEMSRKDLPKQLRLKVNSLITIEIHGRDVIDRMLKKKCTDVTHFEWFSQLRFYWDRERDNCIIRQTNTQHQYGYEYTGNSGRLVITPLTDRCYITLTTALHLHRGGSPKGPAGTGKTETVKDLGKALGMWVIVTNCSEGLDYKSIGKNFSGLAQTGAWGCFDEFNRINIEVLSVVAQQILSILSALSRKLTRFRYEGTEINLKSTVGLFITMNPGYAGRTELPDNLKSMFRPISMIVPDNVIIAENLLFSDGFQNTKILARKVFTLYELAKQQLSKQHHYDFGLRSMVALLRYAGLKRRQFPNVNEEETVYLAMKDMNSARLTSNDLPLFNDIMSDIFPKVAVLVVDYSDFQVCIEEELAGRGLQSIKSAIQKTIELYETKNSRHSVMILGDTGTAKTTTWQVLQGAFQRMRKRNKPDWVEAIVYPINPKSLSLGELYGEYNLATGEWLDGVLSVIMRTACADDSPEQKWILFDGPVDAVWIENMNSVMDDNKVLTLINSERISMPGQVSLLFEVGDLAVASPATVSRCGMVYNDYNDWGWRPYVESWLARQKSKLYVKNLREHFDRFLDKVLDFKRSKCHEIVPMNQLNLVISLCRLLDCCANKENGIISDNEEVLETMTKLWFLFCLVWSVCATVDEAGRVMMDAFVREMEGAFPIKETIYDYYVDTKQRAFVPWEDRLSDNWRYNKDAAFHKIIVPTVDTVRYEYIVSKLLSEKLPVMMVGKVGTGKSSTASSVIETIDKDSYTPLLINLSAQTTSKSLQESIESRTEKRTKGVYVPIGGKTMICFLDDFNMPAKDTYGSQAPLELIRQWIDYEFWYDRKTQKRIYVKNLLLLAAMGPSGGGRQEISARTLSRFSMINMTFPSESTITRIFGTMLRQKLSNFVEETKQLSKFITSATIHLYMSVSAKMLPTPAKIHYLFNLRDISRVFQGLLRSHNDYHVSRRSMIRLWIHECFRVFHDRLVDQDDVTWFHGQINEQLGRYFETTFHNVCPEKSSPIFGDFISNNGYYEDLANFNVLRKYMSDQLEDYNNSPGMARMDLVFFKEAIEHITRIVRVISQPRGHMLIIAIGGLGRQCLSRLAAYICEFTIFQVDVTKKYKVAEFREDLKNLYKLAGVKNKPTMFLFTSDQIAEEAFLEVINNMMSTGEINLFKPDEFEEIKSSLELVTSKLGIPPTTDAIYTYFMETVRNNLHLTLCMSPIGNSFRSHIRQYPALVNCTTIDWFHDWPQEALLEVTRRFLTNCQLHVTIGHGGESVGIVADQTDSDKLTEAHLKEAVASTFSKIHTSVTEMAKTMLTEMKRHSYITPVNYLELVAGFQSMFIEKRANIAKNANKLRNGLSKVQETQDKVSAMSDELKISQEKVSELQQQCDDYLLIIQSQTREADDQKKSVAAKSLVISQEEKVCKALAAQAQSELNHVLPALDNALKALDSLNKKDLSEVKSYGRPPVKVERIMEAVMILLGKSPNWTEAKRQLGEQNFLTDLRHFDRDNISDKTLKRIAVYTQDPELEPEKVGLVSSACKSLSLWIRAIENYGKVYRIVAPKKAKLEQALTSLKVKQEMLDTGQRKLAELNARLEQLQADFKEKSDMQEELKAKSEILKMKLERAVILVESLAGERVRWTETVKQLDKFFGYLPGDCLLSTAFISYLGPFDTVYREMLIERWKNEVANNEIPCSIDFRFIEFLCDPVTIREWNMNGLPSDDFSTENGVIVTKGTRWPLIIDPQGQAHAWIRNFEKGVNIIDFGQADYVRTLENALQYGKPVLLQNVSETLDPILNPILKRAIIIQGGQKLIKFNDKLISYDENFRFYITTKLSNPHYPPEISTKINLVNFAVKENGLQAQLLGIIVRKEKPALEEQNDNLVMTISKNRRTLIDLDNEILRLLNESRGSLLEDNELFVTLQVSGQTAIVVKESLSTAEVTEIEIDFARQAYQPSAKRAAILFFVLMDMSRLDPMYQFSLNAYILLFTQSIERSTKSNKLNDRILYLNEYHTYSVYKNTCRGLFEQHKLLFSFHMCAKILEAGGKLNLVEYNFLIKGGIVVDRKGQLANPLPSWISESAWDNITELDKIPGFHGILNSFEQYPREWLEWYSTPAPETVPLVGEWKDVCNDFQKILILRSLRPDRMSFCLTAFIINILGPKFVEPPVLDLKAVLDESVSRTPLIFVLSPGVDPTQSLIQLAEQQNMMNKLKSLSLGQGQDVAATNMLTEGAQDGHWVFLANCHLSLSWMPALDKMIESFQTEPISKKFRLWLSSSPTPDFPISILQAGIKMTTEPPRGIKANLKRLYNMITEVQFSKCLSQEYKKLLFSLCFFHTVLLERRKFRFLGWNVIYSFNDSDFEVSENLLTLYLNDYNETPWSALKYLIAGVNYGGHVTDDWDRRLLVTYINQFFNDSVITTTNYRLSSLTTYYIPSDGTLQSYRDYIQLLPSFDKAEAFGQHPNADIATLIIETRTLFDTLVSLQVQTTSEEGESKEEKVLKLAQDIDSKIPKIIDYELTSKLIGTNKSPLNVVLLQEIERYNSLLKSIKRGLEDLQNGIKGLLVMSSDLEDMFNAVFEGKVPTLWLRTYPSQKPLASWARDLILRVDHFAHWANTLRPPRVFWLSAFTFPTGYLTAVLQTAARNTSTPIDEISWKFIVLNEDNPDQTNPIDEGVLIRGFYLEGAGWNRKHQCLQQPQPMELITPMPIINFQPVKNMIRVTQGIYNCPCYYYSERSGSFVIAIDLNAGTETADFWIKHGTAIILNLAT